MSSQYKGKWIFTSSWLFNGQYLFRAGVHEFPSSETAMLSIEIIKQLEKDGFVKFIPDSLSEKEEKIEQTVNAETLAQEKLHRGIAENLAKTEGKIVDPIGKKDNLSFLDKPEEKQISVVKDNSDKKDKSHAKPGRPKKG